MISTLRAIGRYSGGSLDNDLAGAGLCCSHADKPHGRRYSRSYWLIVVDNRKISGFSGRARNIFPLVGKTRKIAILLSIINFLLRGRAMEACVIRLLVRDCFPTFTVVTLAIWPDEIVILDFKDEMLMNKKFIFSYITYYIYVYISVFRCQ